MAGKKGSSPNVYKFFKIDGDKLTRLKKIVLDVVRGSTCLNIRTDTLVENVG